MDVDRRQVGEHREQAEAVVNHDGVAGEVQVAGDDDAPGAGRVNRRAGRAQKVGAAMRGARLAVEDAARAERAV